MAIYEYLEHVGLFTQSSQFVKHWVWFFALHVANIIKSNLHMKKSNLEYALNPNATHSQPNVPTLFLLIRKLIIISTEVFN